MKSISKIGACAMLAAGVVTSAFGQLQYAGNNQVSLDFTGLPVGPVGCVTNSIGVAGGVFQAYTNVTQGGLIGLGPQVIALGGSGTHGVLFSANECLLHYTASLAAGGSPQNAPGNLTTTSFTGFSVEAWVYAVTIPDDNPVVSWGTRGVCDPNQISCAYGSDPTWGGLAMWCNDHGWGTVPPAGQWHHLVWTLDTSGNENLYSDGVLNAHYTGVAPNPDPNNNIAIGFSHATTGDSLAGGVFGGGYIVGRVRIDDGILTLAQVQNNYNYEASAFTNGTPVFLTAKPLHRWSFTNAATATAKGLTVLDVGTANGTAAQVNGIIRNNGGTAAFTGSQLTLSGGNSATAPYVDLTNAVLSVLSTNKGGSGQTTIEAWVTLQGDGSWTPLFNFGDNTAGKITGPGGSFSGVDYLTLVCTPGGNENQSAIGFQSGNYVFSSFITGNPTHLALTWDDTTNPGLMTVYENGVEVATTTTTNRLIGMKDLNNWIGRSAWSGDANLQGSIAEFRIFNRIVTPGELLNDYQVGPTVVSSVEKWNGNHSGNWDFTTANWLIGATPEDFNNGGTVQFDDTLTGTANVNVTTTVQPGTLTVNNTHTNYVFSGSGSISGAVGLTKNGSGTLTIDNLNNYTGITALNAGTIIVTNLANGGSPSALGAASAAPVNLALTGGTLSYQGPPVSINRGYVAGAGTLDVENNLAISGQVIGGGGNFTKEGPATLTYNGAEVNQLSAGDFYVNNGTVVMDGTAGETNNISGQIYVGSDTAHGATMILSNTTVNLGNWFAIARGNGTGGYTSAASLNNSVMTCPNLSLGYANGIVGNNQTAILNLNGNSQLIINNGGTGFNLSESVGSTSFVTVSNNAWIYSVNRILIGLSSGSTGSLVVANSGAITNLGYTSIGVPGVATATLQNNAVWQSLTDFNVTDTAGTADSPSLGTLNLMDNATLIISTLYLGKSAYCTGTINQSGGSIIGTGGGDWRIGGNLDNSAGANPNQLGIWNLSGGTVTAPDNFQIGAYGTGYLNQSGGTVNLTAGYPDVGRWPGGVGYLNISGGSFNQLNPGTLFLVGEQGTGTLNVSGTGAVNVMTSLGLGWNGGTGTLNLTNGVVTATNSIILGGAAGGTAMVNLYGGILATKQVATDGGSSTLAFDGGTLLAMPGANANFLSGLSTVSLFTGGAFINSGANSITIGQDLYDGDGLGNLTKLGAGTLTLTGNQFYAGPITVSAGELVLPTTGLTLGTSGVNVADGANLDIQVTQASVQVMPASVSLGVTTGSVLTIDLGTLGNATAAPLEVPGIFTAKGTTMVQILGSDFTIGEFPLVQYGTRAGAGNFVLGSLPPGVVATLVTNVVNSSIDLNITAVNILLWTGINGGNWDVNTTLDWTNILNGTSSTYSQGSSVVFDDSAPGTNAANVTTTLSPSSITFSNNALAYTLLGKGKLSGTTGITLDGTGAVMLSTTNNNFSGSTLLTGGSLTAGTAGALSSNSPVVVDNALLELNASSQTVKNLTASNAIIDGTTATLTGAGFSLENSTVNVALAGNSSLTVLGANGSAEVVTVVNNNSYTGPTVVSGGTLLVTNLANGGIVSSIGVSSASPTNLVLTGGTLSYQGLGASINRGYTVAGNSTLDAEGNLVLGGQITASAGTFTKSGPANLTLNGAGNNTLSVGGGGAALGVANGTLTLGGNAAQTNYVLGETWVGFDQLTGASLILTNTTLTNSSWFAVGRGNGTGGFTSTADLYNSAYTAGNVSFGYDNGIAGNSQNISVTLHGNSQLVDNGNTGFNLSESPGSSGSLVVSNTSSVYSLNRFLVAMSPGSTGSVLIADSASIAVNGGWTDIADSGVGTATLENNAVWQSLTDFNVTDLPGTPDSPSIGTVNILGNAQLIIDTLYVGKAYGNPANGYCTGIINQSGGAVVGTSGGDWRIGGNNTAATALDPTLFGTYNLSGGVVSSPSNLQLGAGGSGEWNQTGGNAYAAAYPSIGRWPNSYGQADIAGGTFNQTNTTTFMLVGESGTGVLNITNTGMVSAVGGLDIGANATGVGTVNLGGGTLSVTHVFTGSGSGTFNFNGGLLLAMPGAYLSFMSGLDAANVLAGGAVINSGANTIDIAQPLLDGGTGGGLTKLGSGTLWLDGDNTYTGTTTVMAGTLGGSGTIPGVVQVNNGATLSAGTGDANSVLTLGSTPVLGGTVVASVMTNASGLSADLLKLEAPLTYSGNLNIVNVGANPLQVGETFTLFSATSISGSFNSITTTSPGQYVKWNVNSPAAGQFTVASVTSSAVPTITNSLSGNHLTLTWPAANTGWTLQVQTNSLSHGLGANWANVPGSTSANTSGVLTVNPANGSVFYRLVYQP